MARADPTTPPPAWHARDAAAVIAALGGDAARGLDDAEAAARLRRHGPNAIEAAKPQSRLALLLAQFTDVMVLLLIGAAALSALIGALEDTAVILAIVILDAVVGFIQAARAQDAVAGLRRLAAPVATVRRQGRTITLPAASLVPGDLVLLEAGNTVPADLRLLEAPGLHTGEAALTGESAPVLKQVAPIAAGTTLPERSCMAYKGTSVLGGRATGIVTATGMGTELGRIATLIGGAAPGPTPLQRQLARFGRQIAAAALAVCVLILATGLLRGEAPLPMLLTALSLAVAAIPEALPAIVTVLLAGGAARMARAQALIRRLPAVETLGAVTTICADKTGTLTLNRMRMTRAWRPPGDADATALLRALVLCNDATADAAGTKQGDPTETAFLDAASAAGLDPAAERARHARCAELPFTAARRRMTTLHRDEDGALVSYTKGAPEAVIPLCTEMTGPAGAVPADPASLMRAAAAMAADGMRVLAVARRRHKPGTAVAMAASEMEGGLECLGLAGLIDPPRPEAAASVATCIAAGIRPVMITGDHPLTAAAIARSIGILDAAAGETAVMTGAALQALDEGELRRRVREVAVFARVDPAQKIRIVTALQDNGEVVAMTGDGVNDAPALAQADIGVAMGRGGTDVAREAASLVLLDDNFATIVAAVREGRRIYDNIRKFVRFVIACNAAEILTIFLAPFFGLPMPLRPIQILWINLVTDGLPGLALTTEPAAPDIMARPPLPPRQRLLAGFMAIEVLWSALLMAAITLLTEAVARRMQDAHWQTMVFAVLTFVQLWQLMAVRAAHARPFHADLGANPPLLGTVLLTVALQIAVIYTPGINRAFGASPLSPGELAVTIAASSVIYIALELAKWARRTTGRTTP
ncbi:MULTISPECIES: HAD-IC family P-type ATPase [unclassified Acidiphilium]|uniref:cation-translocating P-type ATPase n=1 Tax=unclassified Acidiphilium TaxID=2617493 RepID=UPI000BD2E201|nr:MULTISPECIES: HAD-IC family P-type ATPase [unclassified Acidiphilium]OYV55177.1 MAG: ATPase [Acidiphilium sp. 20-67-58]HQT61495.1 HAD-IC family P-type ATPase [Acidiphilium sp.]